MRVHLVWGLRRPQLGLETAAAARYCRMTILQMCVLVIPTRSFAHPQVLNVARVMENWFFMVR